MALPSELHRNNNLNHISNFFQSTASNFVSLFNPPKPSPSLPKQPHSASITPSTICFPLLFAESPKPPVDSTRYDSVSSSNSAIKGVSSASDSNSGFPSTVRVSARRGGGPAFVGQVFSMCDLSGTGLMAVSTHFDIPFISKRFVLLCT